MFCLTRPSYAHLCSVQGTTGRHQLESAAPAGKPPGMCGSFCTPAGGKAALSRNGQGTFVLKGLKDVGPMRQVRWQPWEMGPLVNSQTCTRSI